MCFATVKKPNGKRVPCTHGLYRITFGGRNAVVSGRIVSRTRDERCAGRGGAWPKEENQRKTHANTLYTCRMRYYYLYTTARRVRANPKTSPDVSWLGYGGRLRARSTCAGNVVFRRSVSRGRWPLERTDTRTVCAHDRIVLAMTAPTVYGAAGSAWFVVIVIIFLVYSRPPCRLHNVSPRETVFSCTPLTRFSASPSSVEMFFVEFRYRILFLCFRHNSTNVRVFHSQKVQWV